MATSVIIYLMALVLYHKKILFVEMKFDDDKENFKKINKLDR